MNQLKNIITAAAFCLSSTSLQAQQLQSGYFVDGYLYRHDINPAIGNEQSYVALPGAGHLGVSLNSNIATDKILYQVNGRTALFLHPQVDAGRFLKAVNDKNRIAANVSEQLLGAGFKAWGGYNTIEVNARVNAGLNVPGSLLRLAKQGIENKTYDISDLNAHAEAFGEIALGHSRQIDEQWRVGAKMKFLLGVANLDANFRSARLTLGEDEWVGVTDAELQMSLKEMAYKTETKQRGPEGEETEHHYVSGITDDKWGINGFGLAFDIGAEYRLDDHWTFSAALLDLGFIGWSNNYVASTNGEHEVRTNTYLFSLDDDADNSFEREGDRLGEGLSQLYELQDQGDRGSRSRGLAPVMNLGVEYTPDFYDRMSFGLSNNTRMGKYGWTVFRLSTNVAPVNSFSASASVALGTYGASFGWVLNFHPNGFNFFLGMDHTLGRLAKQGLPLSGRGSLSLGINFPF